MHETFLFTHFYLSKIQIYVPKFRNKRMYIFIHDINSKPKFRLNMINRSKKDGKIVKK